MKKDILSVKELKEKDINLIADYWFTATPEHLKSMGVDPAKMPQKDDFKAALLTQLTLPFEEKKAYAVIWYVNNEPVGHSNVNPLQYGDHAYMHLHIWSKDYRSNGYGSEFIKMSVPYFFNNLKIKTLYCQPFAHNPSPNRTLEKSGFTFVKEFTTTPGAITFEQPVKLWEMKQ